MKRIVIEKAARRLSVFDGEQLIFSCPVALGRVPVGRKKHEGDGRTPESVYFVCLKKEHGKYGASLGLSYPSLADARAAAHRGDLDASLLPLFERAEQERTRPPWGTPLGGEIYIHGGGTTTDWTAGCIALSDADARRVFDLVEEKTEVWIQA